MFLNIRKVFFFLLMVYSKTYSLQFDQFKNELPIVEKNAIASHCIMESFGNERKIVDTAIHTAKRQHIRSEKEVCDAPVVPLCIPIKCEPSFLNFVRDFYLLFDKSAERKGAVTKLNDLLQMNPISAKDIDVLLQIISRTFSINVSFNAHSLVKGIIELSSEIRNIIKILSYVPTKVPMLSYLTQRFESVKKVGILETDPYLIEIKKIDTSGEKSEVIRRFDELRRNFCLEIKEKTLSLLDILGKIKDELDPQIRIDLFKTVVPSMRLAAELFTNNFITDEFGEPTKISSEDMNSVLDESRGKPQIVSTREYIPTSYMQYMTACIISCQLKGTPPDYSVMIKAVVSKESGLVYLSTFFPETRKK